MARFLKKGSSWKINRKKRYKLKKNFTSPPVEGSTAEYLDSQTTSPIVLAGPRGISGNEFSQSYAKYL